MNKKEFQLYEKYHPKDKLEYTDYETILDLDDKKQQLKEKYYKSLKELESDYSDRQIFGKDNIESYIAELYTNRNFGIPASIFMAIMLYVVRFSIVNDPLIDMFYFNIIFIGLCILVIKLFCMGIDGLLKLRELNK